MGLAQMPRQALRMMQKTQHGALVLLPVYRPAPLERQPRKERQRRLSNGFAALRTIRTDIIVNAIPQVNVAVNAAVNVLCVMWANISYLVVLNQDLKYIRHFMINGRCKFKRVVVTVTLR
jgi:hypothetical protein